MSWSHSRLFLHRMRDTGGGGSESGGFVTSPTSCVLSPFSPLPRGRTEPSVSRIL